MPIIKTEFDLLWEACECEHDQRVLEDTAVRAGILWRCPECGDTWLTAEGQNPECATCGTSRPEGDDR